MQEFQILDEKRYPIKPSADDDLLIYWRFEHRVTLGNNFKEYVVMVDNLHNKVYIEELSAGGDLLKINDEELHLSLATFAAEQGFCEILPPLPKPVPYYSI